MYKRIRNLHRQMWIKSDGNGVSLGQYKFQEAASQLCNMILCWCVSVYSVSVLIQEGKKCKVYNPNYISRTVTSGNSKEPGSRLYVQSMMQYCLSLGKRNISLCALKSFSRIARPSDSVFHFISAFFVSITSHSTTCFHSHFIL